MHQKSVPTSDIMSKIVGNKHSVLTVDVHVGAQGANKAPHPDTDEVNANIAEKANGLPFSCRPL